MPLPKIISSLINDPPPRYIFEVSELGIAVARTGRPPQVGFQPLDPDVIAVSPVKDNVLRPDVFAARVGALAPRTEKKKMRAVLIVPDFAVRVSVLDFDGFPGEPAEQRSLVRFRLKKTLPFDLDAAGLSYFPQTRLNGSKKLDIVVAVAPMEILARYEAPFRAAGFQAGLITTSTLCAVEMVKAEAVAVLAKLNGRTLTIAVLQRAALKLLRTLELAEKISAEEIASHLYPTFAYVEDQLGGKPEQVLTCGLGRLNQALSEELGEPCIPLRSRYGMPEQHNAGLLGYLETVEEYS